MKCCCTWSSRIKLKEFKNHSYRFQHKFFHMLLSYSLSHQTLLRFTPETLQIKSRIIPTFCFQTAPKGVLFCTEFHEVLPIQNKQVHNNTRYFAVSDIANECNFFRKMIRSKSVSQYVQRCCDNHGFKYSQSTYIKR
jgi:hypothetical protein